MAQKISPSQQFVIDKMLEGWELGKDNFNKGKCWLQKNGIGHGGEAINVSSVTVEALKDKSIIKESYGFPVSKFTIKTK